MAIDQDIGIQNSSQKEFQNLLEKDFKGRELKEKTPLYLNIEIR